MTAGDQAEGKGESKTEGQLLSEKLFVNKKNIWDSLGSEEEGVYRFAEDYKKFLDAGKTERECITAILEALNGAGFQDISDLRSADRRSADPGPLVPGDRVYQNNRDKSLVCAVIGKQPVSAGVNIIGAHVDSPRIDLKGNPLYEDTEFAFLDTHYYGGIKTYQWTTIPLALHGVVIREDGRKIEICVGEDDKDPIFTITDLLPHLAREQMQKKASEFVGGEDLNVLAGSRPFQDAKAKDKVKLNLLNILHEQYGMVEQDFAGAELELVPAFKSRDLGFDRSMIGGYGHDDRCCVYATLRAALDMAAAGSPPEKTIVAIFTDKEETGSAGNTGAQSRLFENFIAFLVSGTAGSFSEILLRQTLGASCMLSGDVNSAFDPNFDGVYDRKNSSFFGKGIGLSKHTGSGGKFNGSEANAEFCGRVQGIFNRNKVQWQYGDLGKVDKGGGGTIAKYVANLGLEVLDCGIPVLSMHSPFEVISKIDLYTTYQGYGAFFREG
ncbi:putative M18 family aminopeptidase 1 [Spirochaetia bacterium]|nr:putative M18 family aminopeptidase 1 [Spirochaetia bacterium]